MLDRLSPNEQKALMELLIFMAKADGAVDDIEGVVLQQYADLVHVDFDSLEGDFTPDELVPQFESPASKVAVLQELFRLSLLNGIFTDGEQSAILDVGAQMAMPMELLRKIEAWVMDDLRLTVREEELVEEAERLFGRL